MRTESNRGTMDSDTGIPDPLSRGQKIAKRTFDISFATIGLVLTGWLIGFAHLAARIDTGESGFFRQERVGKHGDLFRIIKIRTMRNDTRHTTTVTTSSDPRITSLGHFFRQSKIDELPQLINILVGDMSFVGPRPDVPGYADELEGSDRMILSVRPGVTGPATLAFPNEENMLTDHTDPERFNKDVLYPKKIELNRFYLENYSFLGDIRYVARTLLLTMDLWHPPSINLGPCESDKLSRLNDR